MALDHLGQRLGCPCLDRGLDLVLVVRGEFRQLQQNLWLTRGSRWLHDMDLDIEHGDPWRCRDRSCPGAPRSWHREIIVPDRVEADQCRVRSNMSWIGSYVRSALHSSDCSARRT